MTIITLKQRPDLFESAIELIEKSFHYDKSHSFKVDFAPLVNEDNFENIFIKINPENKVIAHIACKTKFLNHHPVIMLGGIAVDPLMRGEGHFQELMSHVLINKKDEASLFLLWSDQEKLYRKFGFYLCGQQFEHEEKTLSENDYIRTSFVELSDNEKEEIKLLFKNSFQKNYLTFNRDKDDWKLIEKMNSANLFIRKTGGEIQDYFFINKGQDLSGIIYEYGTKNDLVLFLKNISSYGKVWTAFPISDSDPLHFQFMASPGDKKLFSEFIFDLSQGKIKVHEMNSLKQEIYFNFGEDLLALGNEELLKGLLGPGIFEELPDIKKIFLSGLDSV